jgi:hypothetical protein
MVAGMLAALALTLPAQGQSPAPSPSPAASETPYAVQRPTAVVVRLEGGFHPVNQWLSYEHDGTARFAGILDYERGRFHARVDFAKVEQILSDAEMCKRHGTIVRPASLGMDMFYYRVSVRCGNAWRMFTAGDAFEPKTVELTRRAVNGLEVLASKLAWQRSDDQAGPPDTGRVYFNDRSLEPR